MKKIILNLLFLMFLPCLVAAETLPTGFVYLKDIDPSILQDMRYAGNHNFIGHPINGYHAGECILTREAAIALSNVQAKLKKSSLSLKVYDCYRPQKAVEEFISWSKEPSQQQMKAEFYPRVDKADFFKLGYVAAKSGHTRGSTIDLTIVPLPTPEQTAYHAGDKLIACFAAHDQRFGDNSIDMGTGFDCLDESAHADNKRVGEIGYQHRMLLQSTMMAYGFVPYPKEWWHFTLKNEPYPQTYFNFDILKHPTTVSLNLTHAQQLLLVNTQNWNAFNGTLQRYQRNSDLEAWQAVGQAIPVVIGKHGLAWDASSHQNNTQNPVKKEGDLRTPVGIFNIVSAFGFDKKSNVIKLPYLQLTKNNICVDDQKSMYYNQIIDQTKVSHHDWQSGEKMREIELYKMGAVISFNYQNPVRGNGSCVFMHVWKTPQAGTAGCVAMSEENLNSVLSWLNPEKNPAIAVMPPHS